MVPYMQSLRLIFKRLAYWIIPVGVSDRVLAGLWFIYALAPSKRRALKINRELFNRHAGARCFILATGPSIRSQNLKLLKDEFCISVSNCFVHPDYALIKPAYHCMASYHPPITEEGWRGWMKETAARTGDSTLFFGLQDLKRNQRDGVFSGRSVYYLGGGALVDPLIRRKVDLAKPIVGPASVTVMAIQVALYLGFKRIYLLGCDHDWILHIGQSAHCYDEKEHALVMSGYNEWGNTDLESEFVTGASLWHQYKAIRRIANNDCVEIFNATSGGLLDVFPRVKYESLFGQNK